VIDRIFYFDKLKKLYKEMDKLLSYSDRDCGNCVDCCLNVSDTFMFLPLYIDYINHNLSSENKYPLLTWEEAYELSLCPYLDLKKRRCGIYELRPVVCRLFPRLSEVRETSLYHKCVFYEDYELSGLEVLPFLKEIEEVYIAISSLNLSYIKKNNYSRVRQYRELLENPPDSKEKRRKDMELYGKAIITAPFLPALHYNMARLYQKLGDMEGAKREIEITLRMDEGDYRAIFFRAGIFEMEKRREEAAEEIKKAIELNPQNLTAHYNLGMIYLMDEKYSEAGYYFKKLLFLNPRAGYRFKNLDRFIKLCEEKK